MSSISGTGRAAARVAGWLAVVSTTAYFLSDVLEASHGGFTTVQLWLTLASEAALPAVAVGLYQVQRPQIGRLGRYGAVAYAVAYLYFTYTVIYALAHGTPDFAALNHALNPAMTVFGAVMVAAGIAFGTATYHARVLPGWTGLTLAAGVVLVVVMLGLPAAGQLTATGVRDLAFIGMGFAALRSGSGKQPVIPPPAPPSPPSVSRLPDGGQADAGQASAAAGPDGIDLYWLPLGADATRCAGTGKSMRPWPHGMSYGAVKTSTTRPLRCVTAATGTSSRWHRYGTRPPPTAASSAKDRSVPAGSAGSAPSGTRCAAGKTARSRTCSKQLTAPGDSAKAPPSQPRCCNARAKCPRSPGDVTSSAPERCGTPTRWSPGCSQAADTTWPRSRHRLTGVPQAGPQACS